MKLNPKTMWTIVALSVVALIGIAWLQVQLLMSAAEQKEEAFRHSVAAALTGITQKLETNEAVGQLFASQLPSMTARKVTIAVLGMESKGRPADEVHVEATGLDQKLPINDIRIRLPKLPLEIKGNKVQYTVATSQHIRLRMIDVGGHEDTLLVDTVKAPGVYEAILDTSHLRIKERVFHYSTDSASFVMSVAHDPSGMFIAKHVPTENREETIRNTFDKLIVAEGLPIERRLTPAKLDSVIGATLRESGIDLPYAYGVLDGKKDSLRMMNAAEYANELKQSAFTTRLFPGDLFAERYALALFFPDRREFLLKQMSPMIAATFVFVTMIASGFGYTIRTIFKQKRIATHMVEFINNMVHEFKTPISTISLASQAIARPDVLTNAEKVIRYNEVIHDENARMRHQVEKILQMAVLEEGDYELQVAPVDLHEIIKSAAANIALQIESKQGTIATALNASRHVINADAVHLTNIIHNLLDNANKYSPDQPCIEVTTENAADTIVLRVSDKGIGMSTEDAKRAFDKYYRVSTGNQHDVKGFGLGLSYVKLMVEAHGGTATIESESAKGTIVELMFPNVTKEA